MYYDNTSLRCQVVSYFFLIMQLYQLTLHLSPANTTFERTQRVDSVTIVFLSVESLCYMILKYNCSYKIKAQTVTEQCCTK